MRPKSACAIRPAANPAKRPVMRNVAHHIGFEHAYPGKFGEPEYRLELPPCARIEMSSIGFVDASMHRKSLHELRIGAACSGGPKLSAG